jgi:uncharacterized membrane protein (UPF0136 family)
MPTAKPLHTVLGLMGYVRSAADSSLAAGLMLIVAPATGAKAAYKELHTQAREHLAVITFGPLPQLL